MDLHEKYFVKKLTHPHEITVEVPGSKSITNRALLIAALASGKSILTGVLFSDDSRHFLAALADLGFEVEINEAEHVVAITGCGGRIPKKEAAVDVGSAGTAARFLTALLGLSEGRYRMDASEQMKKRPMQELLTTLESLGTEITYEEETYHFPYIIGRRKDVISQSAVQDTNLTVKTSAGDENLCVITENEKNLSVIKTDYRCSDEVTIDIDKSSQFLSALLIVSVLFPQGLTIHVTGSHGMAYVQMTVELMRQFGLTVEVSKDARTYRIAAGTSYQPREYRIEPDLSAACYFYAAGAMLGVPAKVLHVHRNSLQGDIRFLLVLCDMGCELREDEDGIMLLPSEIASAAGLSGGNWDLSAFSDQALTLAAIAPFADSTVEICGVGHIRYQECDRIHAILENLHAMGVRCEETDGNIRIYPSKLHSGLHGAQIQTYEDHRVAMAFTIPGLLLEGQVILNPACCRKTFEDFFEVLEAAVY